MDIELQVQSIIEQSSYQLDRERPTLGLFYTIIKDIMVQVSTDARTAFRNFFPVLSNRKHMEIHAKALHLPHIANESDQSLQKRLLHASTTFTYLGTRKALTEYLNSHYKNRYTIVEMPKDAFTVGSSYYATPINTGKIMNGEGLYIYIKNLTQQEREALQQYIETNTPPDVGYKIFNT